MEKQELTAATAGSATTETRTCLRCGQFLQLTEPKICRQCLPLGLNPKFAFGEAENWNSESLVSHCATILQVSEQHQVLGSMILKTAILPVIVFFPCWLIVAITYSFNESVLLWAGVFFIVLGQILNGVLEFNVFGACLDLLEGQSVSKNKIYEFDKTLNYFIAIAALIIYAGIDNFRRFYFGYLLSVLLVCAFLYFGTSLSTPISLLIALIPAACCLILLGARLNQTYYFALMPRLQLGLDSGPVMCAKQSLAMTVAEDLDLYQQIPTEHLNKCFSEIGDLGILQRSKLRMAISAMFKVARFYETLHSQNQKTEKN